ncbi:hypothetical protein VHA01S_032_00080 [Vibrio halioticoli NBRC 102217]|uniref:TOD1/MUCI70 glycosyltransferase-like domain-containing protein n=1 Tax=Vibrio halioticoli NBRC 102217 TaxID=1219072 RepID=V5FEF6_9VIBR|nr:glycosyltransferase domain-containing protein [Vibrio halioticoli]GAD90058.1 hypothetical protein VHA01S_032_00080 [Vibrio halioticoli NBRC 102217]
MSQNKYLVYTCIFGNYDNLQEISQKSDSIDYICITDDLNLTSNTWNIKYVELSRKPNEANREYKMLPHKFFPMYESSIYVDGNISIQQDLIDFFKDKDTILSISPHSLRNCIYKEAKACIKENKLSEEVVLNLIEYLKSEDYPKNNGLFENNILFRRNTYKLNLVMEDWFDLFCNGIQRDQLTLCYLLYKQDLCVKRMDHGPRYSHKFFKLHLHKSECNLNVIKRVYLISRMRIKVGLLYKVIFEIFEIFIKFKNIIFNVRS